MKLDEKWYECDFKEKYPNGVLCWVWNDKFNKKYRAIFINYISNTPYPSWSVEEVSWKYTEPAIIGE